MNVLRLLANRQIGSVCCLKIVNNFVKYRRIERPVDNGRHKKNVRPAGDKYIEV